jgi:23S rRNA (guanine745-N1)-methyltransferase
LPPPRASDDAQRADPGTVESLPSAKHPAISARSAPRVAHADLGCPRGHRFNVARSGYVNLLQPQERHSKQPGDSKLVVAARRRLVERGASAPLLDALVDLVASLDVPRDAAVLDVGCGEGTMLAALQEKLGFEAWGIDISTAAIDAAARRHSNARWIVANADRALPFADGSFALILSITGRRNAPELARVAADDARALFVLPAEDDQAELREAVLGRASREDRLAKLIDEIGGSWTLESRRDVRWSRRCDATELADLLASTYRGARKREQERFATVDALEVTWSYSIGCFRRA